MDEKIKQFLKTIKMNESMLSMLFGMVTVVLVGLLVFRMYQANKPEIVDEGASDQIEQVEMVGDVPVMMDEEGKKRPTNLADTYVVKEGDHLWSIAEANYGSGYNWVDIASANELGDPGMLAVGQELKLPDVPVIEVETQMMAMEPVDPITGDSYTVQKGDNLWEICVRAYSDGYRWTEVASANELADPNYIEVEQVIKLPR